jgi:hypothetical protein
MGDVGAVATFLDDLFRYFAVDPDGWKRQSVERQLEILHATGHKAMQAKDWAAYDRVLAEHKRLRETTA